MRAACLLAACALGGLAAGCERATASRPASASVVLARVNGVEISAPETAGTPSLEKVIERELLVQKALAAGLDREPRVKQALDDAKRELLAQAYLERAAAAGARSTLEEVRAFYADNPALFAERRIYRLRELAVAAPTGLVEALRAEASRVRDLDQLAAWLRSRKAGFTAVNLTQPAEQLPLSQLPQLARMKEGDIAVFATPLGASVVQLLQAEEAPLSEPQAAPLIEKFLAARQRMALAAAEVRRLRESARIEYVGQRTR